MSSTTRLLVLGVVKLFQPVHGYEVRRELISWRAQEWASIQPGSIYNALKTLTRDGLLEIASTNQVGGRPERTTYRLTSAGQEEFHTLLREEWWNVRPPVDPLMAAVSFLTEIARAEAIAALEHRAAQIHGMVRHVEFGIEAHDGRDSPYHVREMMRLMNARVAAELAWSQQFLARLRAGEYATADDPPWKPQPRPPATAAPDPRRTSSPRNPRPRSNGARRGPERARTERTRKAAARRSPSEPAPSQHRGKAPRALQPPPRTATDRGQGNGDPAVEPSAADHVRQRKPRRSDEPPRRSRTTPRRRGTAR